MRLNSVVAISVLICALLLFPLLQHQARSDDPDAKYSTVDPPVGFELSNISSIHKVSNNEFYVLFPNLPALPSPEQFASVDRPDSVVYHYLNGSWSQVTFDYVHASFDYMHASSQIDASLNRIGGSGSSVFAVGIHGQIHKITGDNAATWKDVMGPPDSSVNLYGVHTKGSSVIAVGEGPLNTNSTQAQAVVYLGSTTSKSSWNKVYVLDSAQLSRLKDVDGDGSGNIVAVGSRDGNYAFGIFSTNGGSTWTPIDFSAFSDLPPLKTVSYYPNANVFFLGGDDFILWYSPGNNPASSNDTPLPLNTYIEAIYQDTAVGFQGMMASGAVCKFIPNTSGRSNNPPVGAQGFGGEWVLDPNAPSGLALLAAIDGGSDVIIVGEDGTILRGIGDPRPVPAAALPVPTISRTGMAALLLGMIIAVIVMFRRRSRHELS